MLRVRLEIVPCGDEDKAYEIGRLDIFNACRVGWSDYEYGVIEIPEDKSQAGMFTSYILHDRDQGAWELVRKAIHDLDVPQLRRGRKT